MCVQSVAKHQISSNVKQEHELLAHEFSAIEASAFATGLRSGATACARQASRCPASILSYTPKLESIIG